MEEGQSQPTLTEELLPRQPHHCIGAGLLHVDPQMDDLDQWLYPNWLAGGVYVGTLGRLRRHTNNSDPSRQVPSGPSCFTFGTPSWRHGKTITIGISSVLLENDSDGQPPPADPCLRESVVPFHVRAQAPCRMARDSECSKVLLHSS